MRFTTFLFYVLPLLVAPVVTGWFIYHKGGTELLYAHWQIKVLTYVIVCAIAFLFHRLDSFITRPKIKARGGIRRNYTGE